MGTATKLAGLQLVSVGDSCHLNYLCFSLRVSMCVRLLYAHCMCADGRGEGKVWIPWNWSG